MLGYEYQGEAVQPIIISTLLTGKSLIIMHKNWIEERKKHTFITGLQSLFVLLGHGFIFGFKCWCHSIYSLFGFVTCWTQILYLNLSVGIIPLTAYLILHLLLVWTQILYLYLNS